MKVSKWGGSLAVRLPKELVELRGLVDGDDVDIYVRKKEPDIQTSEEKRLQFLKSMERFNWKVPEGYKFDREEANERGGQP